MSPAPHLHPKTYWEKRCALLEESMTRVLNILAMCGSQQQRSMMDAHVRDWNRLLGDLAAEYPPPEKDMKCPICAEETAGQETQQWGPELAHVRCAKAYSLGGCDARADLRERLERLQAIEAAARNLTAAIDKLDEGCREPGFCGFRNGNNEPCGDEVQSTREALAALLVNLKISGM